MSENKKLDCLRKYARKNRIAAAAAIVLLILWLGAAGTIYFLWNMGNHEVVSEIEQYEYVLGAHGKYKQNYIGRNDIFPDTIPASAKVETFYYEYYNPWDACYLGHLVYTCGEADFEAERQRLKQLNSTKDYLVYGAEGFTYELCAVYADDYYGYIYALADTDNNRMIYVDLQFCNSFTDIDYEKIIAKEHLPIGFDANER